MSTAPSILGLFEPPAVSVVFWLYPLFYTHWQRCLVCLSHFHCCRVNTGQQPSAYIYSIVPTIFKLLELTAILKEQVNINVFSCCATAGCKMAFHLPFPPPLSTMCDGLIRNWYRRDNGCLALCLSPTEILSLSAASTPSPACLLALSSSPSWDSCPM